MTASLSATVRTADRSLSEHSAFGDSGRILAKVMARLTAEGGEFVRWLSESLAPVAAEAFPEPAPARRTSVVFRRARGLRPQPVESAECLMVFSRSARKIHRLDLNAWLIFELCDGRTRPELERAYLEAVADRIAPGEVGRQLEGGLDALLRERLIEQSPVHERR